MSALFNRRTRNRDDDFDDVVDDSESFTEDEEEAEAAVRRKNAPTPKRPKTVKARPPKNPPMTYKEARQRAKQQRPGKDERKKQSASRRAERERIAEGQWRGDPLYDKYHMPRDRGPERLLARDVVDSRHSVGQYFFMIALVIMLFSSPAWPSRVQITAQLMWIVVLLAFVINSVFLCRKVKKLVWSRFPKTEQRKRGLYWYVITRSIMFRRMRMPRPRIATGTKDAELGRVFRD